MAGVVGICRCLNVSKTIFCKPVYSRGVHMCVVNCVQLFVTPWTVACQDPLSMKISRQEYWSGLSFSSPGDLLDPGIKPRFPALQTDSLPTELQGRPSWGYRIRYIGKRSSNFLGKYLKKHANLMVFPLQVWITFHGKAVWVYFYLGNFKLLWYY